MLYLDEKDPCRVTRYREYCWSHIWLQWDLRQPIHRTIHLLGAYDSRLDQIQLILMDHKDSGKFCDAIAQLWIQIDHRRWKRILFILDNASYHHSRYKRNFLAQLPNCGVIFLPPYSSELNPIEQRYRLYTKEVFEMGIFTSVKDLLDATSAW